MRPAGVSITNEAHSALLRSVRPRADQWWVGTRVTAVCGPSATRSCQSIRLGADRRIVVAHDRVVAERRDHSRVELRGEARQRLDVEMVVVAMRDQHDVDRRQGVERDAGIVHPDRPEKADRRDASRPHRIDQDVQPRGLQQPARMAHIGEAPFRPLDARGRRVAVRARRGSRPFGLLAPHVPAHQRREALRRRRVRIEEARAVEMVRHRAVIVARRGGAQAEHACDRRDGGETGKQAAAGKQAHDWLSEQRRAECARRVPHAIKSTSSVASGNLFASCQLQIHGIIEGQTMAPRQIENLGFVRSRLHHYREERKSIERVRRQRFGYSPPPFTHQHRIPDFEPPMQRNPDLFGS